jgi:hypothetical protein
LILKQKMNKDFGQIPWPSPGAASDVATAASHIESLLRKFEYEHDLPPDPDRLPPTGVDIPNADDSQEVVEEVDPFALPEGPGHEDHVYDGAPGGVVDGGSEYLAFYKSFRDVLSTPAVNRWGVFFIKKRCAALATDMSFGTGESFADCLDGLAAFLYSHELYHYRFDAHCLQMEATGGLSVYRPYRRLVASLQMHDWHEESVANFYGLKALQPSRNFTYTQPICDYLRDLVANSPGAYAGGIDKQQRQRSRKDHMAQQAIASLGNSGPSVWRELVKSIIRNGTGLSKPRESSLSSRLQLDTCPVYWIDWIKGGNSIVAPYVASVAEISNDFIKRYLAGVQDHKSDHSFYRIDNGEKVKLPNPHRADLAPHEFQNIIRKAGMTSAQFYKERERTSIWRKGGPRNPVLPPRGT